MKTDPCPKVQSYCYFPTKNNSFIKMRRSEQFQISKENNESWRFALVKLNKSAWGTTFVFRFYLFWVSKGFSIISGWKTSNKQMNVKWEPIIKYILHCVIQAQKLINFIESELNLAQCGEFFSWVHDFEYFGKLIFLFNLYRVDDSKFPIDFSFSLYYSGLRGRTDLMQYVVDTYTSK